MGAAGTETCGFEAGPFVTDQSTHHSKQQSTQKV